MTRKQAISLAIQALSQDGQNEEAIRILHTILEEMPLNRWTEDAIRDSVEQFILDHGRVPQCRDFKKRGLPPHPVIKNRYGITLREWLEKNYPQEVPPLSEAHSKATEDFVREYLRIRPVSGEDYNARRARPASLCWMTIAKYNHTRRWRILLEKLGLPVYNDRDASTETPKLKVNILPDDEFWEQ